MLYVKVRSIVLDGFEEKCHAAGVEWCLQNPERGIWNWNVFNFASIFTTTGNSMSEIH